MDNVGGKQEVVSGYHLKPHLGQALALSAMPQKTNEAVPLYIRPTLERGHVAGGKSGKHPGRNLPTV